MIETSYFNWRNFAGRNFRASAKPQNFLISRGLIFANQHIIDFLWGFIFADFAIIIDKYPQFRAKLTNKIEN